MDPLRLSAPGSVALPALKPPPPPAPPTEAPSAGGLETRDLVQQLAQDLFQRSVQAAVAAPLTETATPPIDLLPGLTGSLLATLSAPPPAADATTLPAPTSTPPGTTVLAGPGAPGSTGTAPVANPAALPADLQAAGPGQESGQSLEFALQTALRFGAGVGPLAAPAAPTPPLGAELVRDATAVPPQRNLQPQAGGPGPEAFAHPQAPLQRALRSYQAPPGLQSPEHVDLLI